MRSLPPFFRRLAPAVLFSVSLSLVSGCGRDTSASPDKSFEEFTARLFRDEVAATTIGLHYTLKEPEDFGLTDVPVSYGSFTASPEAAQASVENVQALLEPFADADLSEENRLTYDVLSFYLESASLGADYVLYQEPLSPVTGIHAQLPVILSEFPFYDKEDVTDYLALLEETDTYFDSLLSFEKAKSEQGLFMPDFQAEEVLEQCQAFLDMGDGNYLYSTFPERLEELPGLSEEEKTSLQEQNTSLVSGVLLPAYENLAAGIQELAGSGVNDQGLCYYPEGKDFYAYVVRQDTGLSEEIPALQEMTEAQIIEDLTAMQRIASQPAGPRNTVSVLESLTPSAILADLQEKITGAFPEIPETSTRIKYVPEAMEDYLSPAFYMIPPIDSSLENVIYINQGQTSQGLELYTTLAHEGWPGHLYQTVYYASLQRDPLRSLLDFGGYTEGWATYAEMMSYYMAPISTAEAALYQKNASVILGLYATADMGIHYDGWSVADTLRFFSSYGISDAETVRSIYELIIGTPGNYLKYYLGYVKFYTLKKEMAARLGEDFSQKKFHQAVLDAGPAPFDVLEDYVSGRLLE